MILGWTQISGNLTQVSVSGDGSHVWGVNTNDNIYYRNGKDGDAEESSSHKWTLISGKLTQVSVSKDGNHVGCCK